MDEDGLDRNARRAGKTIMITHKFKCDTNTGGFATVIFTGKSVYDDFKVSVDVYNQDGYFDFHTDHITDFDGLEKIEQNPAFVKIY